MENLCARLRGLAQDCIDKHLTTSAIFYADKLVTFSGGAPGDVYLLAQAYYAARQYHRALSLLRTSNVLELGAEFTYLGGCCLAEAGEWEEVVALLGDDDTLPAPHAYEDLATGCEPPGSGVRVQAGLCVLRGRAFEALDNRGRAATWYRTALQLDPYCYDAFAALIDGHLLTNAEEVRLVEGLALGAEAAGPGAPGEAGEAGAGGAAGAGGGGAEGERGAGRGPGLLETDRWLALLMRARCKKYLKPEAVEAALMELEAPLHPSLHEAGEPGGSADAAAAATAAAAAAGGLGAAAMHGRRTSGLEGEEGAFFASPPGTAGGTAGLLPYGSAAVQHEYGILPPGGQGSVSGVLDLSLVAGPGGGGGGAFAIPYMTPPRAGSHSGAGGLVGVGSGTAEGDGAGAGAGGGRRASHTQGVGGGEGSGSGTPASPHGQHRRGGRGGGRRTGRGAAAAAAMAAAEGDQDPDLLASPASAADVASPSAAHPHARATPPHGRGQPHPHGYQAPTPMEGEGPSPGGGSGDSAAAAAHVSHGHVAHDAGAGADALRGYGCGLGGNLDVLACRAELMFHRGDYEGAYGLTRPVLLGGRDPYALQLLPVFLAAATQLASTGGAGSGPRTDLYLLGHRLTEEHPDMALAWHAVGCYYLAARHPEAARRHFAKATQLQRGFAPAWLAYGHAFAAQDERDQAMSAYRTAARLFPGLHTPHLGLGAEYCAMANLPLAERALLTAYDTCPDDPAVCHELGVLMYKCGTLAAAVMWFDKALHLLPGGRPTLHWEPTLVALGHCLRKLQRYQSAAECYQAALALSPANPGTLSALGYTAQLAGDPRAALGHYHAALALRPDDPFTVDMLRLALEEFAVATNSEEAAAGAPQAGAAAAAVAAAGGMAAGVAAMG